LGRHFIIQQIIDLRHTVTRAGAVPTFCDWGLQWGSQGWVKSVQATAVSGTCLTFSKQVFRLSGGALLLAFYLQIKFSYRL